MIKSLSSLRRNPKYHKKCVATTTPIPSTPTSSTPTPSTIRERRLPHQSPQLSHDPRTEKLPVLNKVKTLGHDVERLNSYIESTTDKLSETRHKMRALHEFEKKIDKELQEREEMASTIKILEDEVQRSRTTRGVGLAANPAMFQLELRNLERDLEQIEIESARLDEMKQRAEKLLLRKREQSEFTREMLREMKIKN